jgi:OmpA-OmpF porin, OOP family
MPRTFPALLALVLLVPLGAALAQDDWSGFPSSQPKKQEPSSGTPDVPIQPKRTAPPPSVTPYGWDAGQPSPAPAATPAAEPRRTEPPPKRDEPKANTGPGLGTPGVSAPEQAPAAAAEPPAAALSTDGGLLPDGGIPDDQLPIVSKKEKFVEGSEPHSPSTWLPITDMGLDRLTSGPSATGLLHLTSARMGRAGIARVQALGEYFAQNNFPTLNAGNVRTAGTFSASFTPAKWLEVFVAYGAQANTNSRTSPNLLQALGDLTFGLKGGVEIVKSFSIAADLRLLTFSGVGNQSVDRVAVGFAPTAAFTWEIKRLSPYVPVLLHLNFGGLIDNTGNLIKSQRLNAAEEFALGINKYGRLTFGVGAEVPLPIATPFLEYSLEGPIGPVNGMLVGPDGVQVPVTAAMPQILTLGLKVTIIKDLTLLGAVDIGLTRSVGLGVPATMPWNLIFGANFNMDVFQKGDEKIVEIVRERQLEKKVAEKPKTGRVEGVVLEAGTKKPLGGVVVQTGPKAGLVATDNEAGRFSSHELEPGPVKVVATRQGYKEVQADATIVAETAAVVELVMEPDSKPATFEVTVTGKKKPIKATVTFTGGPEEKKAETAEGAAAPVVVEAKPGHYIANVVAEGWLATTREVQAGEGQKMALTFDLQPAPKKSLVVIKEDRIEILQQVHFQTAQSTILADSYPLLNQVVDAIVKSGIKRIRIEGHTDNRGDKVKNQKLSEDRARAVADYLIAQGIDRSRVEAAGFGDTRPVAPNLTARGRELNRRSEFIILER